VYQIIFIFSSTDKLYNELRVSDVTAIWNTNAFWCWVLTVLIFKLKWEPRRLFAVLLATIGVFVVVYGGNSETLPSEQERSPENIPINHLKPSAPVMGNLMTLAAAILYGLYQVLYKKYAALPYDSELMDEDLEYQPVASNDGGVVPNELNNDAVYPPPFGLHPNYMSAGIGIFTMLTLWIMIPVLDYMDIEKFRLPDDLWTVFSIGGIALGGVMFTGGYMVNSRS
jgi:drug/metabolite transporter (DMT)-like permease